MFYSTRNKMGNDMVGVSGIDTRFKTLYNCVYCVYSYNKQL